MPPASTLGLFVGAYAIAGATVGSRLPAGARVQMALAKLSGSVYIASGVFTVLTGAAPGRHSHA
jgi:hypothetical protein